MKFTNQQQNQIKEEETDVIWEDDDYKIVRPFSLRSSILYGFGTRWCISMEDGHYYDEYTNLGVLFFILQKNGNENNPYYKVMGWKPYLNKLPIKRGPENPGYGVNDYTEHTGERHSLLSRYNGLREKTELEKHYAFSMDDRYLYKYTDEIEFYDSLDQTALMPVQYNTDGSLYSTEINDWYKDSHRDKETGKLYDWKVSSEAWERVIGYFYSAANKRKKYLTSV
jgi:hypothetical protein|tara:strand:+ start:6902 stop:7576 length:675 start_codon:yes stop_codon:yes gene_type:complete